MSESDKIPGVSDEEYNNISQMIGSEDSVVGIDAKKTHIYIIHKLDEISKTLNSLNERINKLERK